MKTDPEERFNEANTMKPLLGTAFDHTTIGHTKLFLITFPIALIKFEAFPLISTTEMITQ